MSDGCDGVGHQHLAQAFVDGAGDDAKPRLACG
jgi:hypothetical protein